ncbi:MAG: tetratricopeptide repeat protein, partial [Candidatus Hydrogenedentes bacterium]|nr:tetratricopeptide repeat protein [Candidatus Hydrogenedentota bacterium]
KAVSEETPKPGEGEPPASPEIIAPPEELSWQILWKQAQLAQLLEQSEVLLAKEAPNLRETLVLTALFSGDQTRAQEIAEELPDDAPLRKFLTALEERKPETALKVFESWTETDPERAILRDNAYGFALMMVGARAKAMQELSARYAKSPENVVALYNLATLYRTAQLPQYATQVLDRLLLLYPNNLAARSMLLALLIENGNLERARGVAELTYQLYPNKPQSVVDAARIYRITGELDLAESILKKALATMPENGPVRIAGTQIHLLKGDPDAALQLVEGHAFEGQTSVIGEALRAFALALKKDWPGVIGTCEGIPADARSLGIHLLLAAAHVQQGNADAATESLRQAGDISWSRISRNGVVAAVLGKGDPPAGADDLVADLKAQPEAFAAFTYGTACMAESLFDAAFSAYEEVASAIPTSPTLTATMLDALSGSFRIENPVQRAQALANEAPDDPRTWIALAEFYRARKNIKDEGEALQKAIALDESNVMAWMLQARYLEREQDKKGAIEAYERVVALRPGEPIINNNLAYLILETGGDAQRALELAQDALEKAQDNPVIQPHVLHTLGLAELRAGKLDEAEKHLGLALQMRPGDPTLLLDFGNLLIKKGDTESGQRQIRRAVEYAERFGLDFPRKGEAEALVAAETS